MLILEMAEYREMSLSRMLICNRLGSKESKQKSCVSHGRGTRVDPSGFPLWMDIHLKIGSHSLPEWLIVQGLSRVGGTTLVFASLFSCVHLTVKYLS